MPLKRKDIGKKNKEKPRLNLKEKVTEVLELPKEIVLNIPRFTMLGNSDLVIENFKGVIEYSDSRIRVNSGIGIVKITGSSLIIREITSEDIMVSGDITSVEFQK